ncbi:MAG: hypothetical protein JST30_07090 [Armatimonadetes bacterium]|nr:hypothetical protein [Armatimonadota bacterium]
MAKPSPLARIDGILASRSPLAVVFRRGPSKLTQLLVWDTDTDSVAPGQWIRGRVYTKRCDVSPDGQLMVGAFTNYSSTRQLADKIVSKSWEECGWTAVSRPPYFSAIALWFTGSEWNGGGVWQEDGRLSLNDPPGLWKEAKAPPSWLKARRMSLGGSEDEPVFTTRLQRHGWDVVRKLKVEILNPSWSDVSKKLLNVLEGLLDPRKQASLDPDQVSSLLEDSVPRWRTDAAGLMVKSFANGRLERHSWHDRGVWKALDSDGRERLSLAERTFESRWLDVDHRGRVIFGDKGCLWAWDGFPDGSPTLVADLNANTFENVPPPEWAVSRERGAR